MEYKTKEKNPFWTQQIHFKRSEVLLMLSGFGIWLMGALSNCIVKVANAGKMPVTMYAGFIPADQAYRYISTFGNNVKLCALSDCIRIGSWYVSIGDLLLAIGWVLFVMVNAILLVRKYKETKKLCSHSPNSGR